jgi:hypothetical protein
MSTRHCKDPKDVLKIIRWISSNSLQSWEVERLYQQQLENYLIRPVHLVHPLLDKSRLTEDEKNVQITDKCHRARRFLLMLTGSPLLPIEGTSIKASHLQL